MIKTPEKKPPVKNFKTPKSYRSYYNPDSEAKFIDDEEYVAQAFRPIEVERLMSLSNFMHDLMLKI